MTFFRRNCLKATFIWSFICDDNFPFDLPSTSPAWKRNPPCHCVTVIILISENALQHKWLTPQEFLGMAAWQRYAFRITGPFWGVDFPRNNAQFRCLLCWWLEQLSPWHQCDISARKPTSAKITNPLWISDSSSWMLHYSHVIFFRVWNHRFAMPRDSFFFNMGCMEGYKCDHSVIPSYNIGYLSIGRVLIT